MENSPDYEDHDFNLQGYKVCISGYMSLEFSDDEPKAIQTTSDDSFNDIDFHIEKEVYQEFIECREKDDVQSLLNEILDAVDKRRPFVSDEKYVKDKYDRMHIQTPSSGPSFLAVRAIKYQQSNIVGHVADLESITNLPQHGRARCS